jgi:hypothetical protein
MATNIYYNPKEKGLFITSNFEERQKRMDLGIFPRIDYKKINNLSELENYSFDGIAFDKVDNDYFQSIKEIFSKYKFKTVAFHETTSDLSDVVLDVKHLIVGDNSKINLSSKNFKNLNEITFLSVKNFKGKILDEFKEVEKLILWYENKKSNLILEKFPRLKEFWINNGSIVELDVTKIPLLEILELHRCIKLEKVTVASKNSLKKVVVEASNKLDASNFLNMKIDFRRW